MSNIEDLSKLKVAELRAELQSRGLDSKGVKAVLIDRLRAAIESEAAANTQQEEVNETNEEEVVNDNAEEAEANTEVVQEPEPEQEPEVNNEEQVQNGQEVERENGDTQEQLNENEMETQEVDNVAEVNNAQNDQAQDYSKKLDYEEAPMETLDDIKKEAEYEPVVKQEVNEEVPVQAEVKQEDTPSIKEENVQVKEEVQERTEEENERRGVKRAPSPSHQETDLSAAKKARPDVEELRVEDEPEFDMNEVALDWYNSDLSLIICKDTRLQATPLTQGGFAYVWHGSRATYGCVKGRIYYEVKVEDHLNVDHLEAEEMHPHVVRCGWSVDAASMNLGEERLSYGYGGTGKASTNLRFKDYGKPFGKGDIIGCFLDLDREPIAMSFTVNGAHQGICYEIPHMELGDNAIFPHILTKNCTFKVNFGTEDSWCEPLTDYQFIGQVPVDERVLSTQGPEKREDSEVIMMIGLPAAGKTTWVENYCREHPDKKYNVLGTNNLIDKMKVMGLPRKRNYAGRWDNLIEKCTKCLNKLLHMSTKRRRNFIIDQTNVYPSAQKRKIKGFTGCKRRAIVVCPTDEDLKRRTQKREAEEGKDVPDKAVLEMKANFKLPDPGDLFDDIQFTELEREDAEKLIEMYNKEGEKAGFGPKKSGRGGHPGGRRGNFIDRRGGGYNHRGGGGYRGGWDRDRDRRGSFDRRDRGGGGGGGWNHHHHRDNRDHRGGGGMGGGRGSFRDNRPGGFHHRDRGNRGGGGSWQGGGGGGGGGGGYKGANPSNLKQTHSWGGAIQGGGPSFGSSWSSGGGSNSGGGGSGGGGGQGGGYGSSPSWGGQQPSYSSPSFSWSQPYYSHQQTQPPTQQAPPPPPPQQPYWQSYGSHQTAYPSQTGYNPTTGYGTQSSYGYNQSTASSSPQHWSGYGSSYQAGQYRK